MKRKDFSDLEIKTQNNKEVTFEHENFIAGIPPFLRGIDTTMYLEKCIKTHLIVNLASPEKSNTFIKEHILKGHKAFILDINTSSSFKINSGIFIASIKEMKTLLKGISLEELSITLSTNNSILTVLGLFLAATKQLDVAQENLNLSVSFNSKNAITDSEFHQNTIEAILKYSVKNLPNFKTISIETPNSQTVINKYNDLAYFLATTFEHISYCISKDIPVDFVASRISFNYKIGNDYIFEISKMRAARMLWAKMIQQFKPKKQASLALKIHSLNYFGNYFKVVLAILGGAQSIISSNKIAKFIQQETFISKTVDPWAGSTSIEKLTEKILNNSWSGFKEIQELGGFSQVILQNKDLNLRADSIKENLLEVIVENFSENVSLEQLHKIINS